jgi:tripartite-type tricarboxylate transporter receptor subunit TctC
MADGVRSCFILLSSAFCLGLALSGASSAQTASTGSGQAYPVKPIRLIVPFVPGGNSDIIARSIAPEMSKALGQPIVIENRGGAGGLIGTELAAKSPPDGYTLLMVSAAHTINPAMAKKLPYDAVKDFAAIAIVADVPATFMVHPSIPARNVREFIVLARSRPGELNYSSAGRGSVSHLSGELFSSMAKVKMVHIAYKGSGASVIDLIAGHTQVQFSSMPVVLPHARSGRLKMLAQAGAKRSPAAPDVPTVTESGLPGYVVSSGFSMFAPANTPRAVIGSVNAAIVRALADPAVRNGLARQGADPVGSTPEQHEAFNKAEIAKWIKVVREAGIQPE